MITALLEKDDKIKYAKIGNNLHDIEHGEMTWDELNSFDVHDSDKVIIASDASQKLVETVDELTTHVPASLERVDSDKAYLTANWLNLGNKDLKAIEFPHIAYVDEPHQMCLYLVDSPTSIKKLCVVKEGHLTQLLKQFEKDLDIEDLADVAKNGDESTHEIKFVMEEPKDSIFSGLKEFFSKARDQFKGESPESTGDTSVDTELKRLHVADFAASFQDAYIKYLIYRIFEAAGDTGINLITIGGPNSRNQRLKELAVRLADEVNYDLRFPEEEHYQNPAIGLAARAHIDEYRDML